MAMATADSTRSPVSGETGPSLMWRRRGNSLTSVPPIRWRLHSHQVRLCAFLRGSSPRFSARGRPEAPPPHRAAPAVPTPEETLGAHPHFVGDIHQPLHAADNDDRGGNDVHVRFFGRRSNLHSV